MRLVVLSLAFASVCLAQADHHRPARVYDLRHVRWALSFDEAKGTIRGDVANTLVPLRPGTGQVWFDSVKLTIESASVNGKPAKHFSKNNRVTVVLPKKAGPKNILNVRLKYRGKPEAGLYIVPASRAFPSKHGMVYTQGEMEDTRCYIPTYDHPDDKATSESFVTVPVGYTVISNGRLMSIFGGRNVQTVHHKMEQPHATYLISLVAGNYATGTESWSGIPVRWNVPRGLEAMGESSFAGTDKMVAFFSRLTGVKYPYAKFDQSVVSDYMFGGMENITAVTNTITTLHPPEAKPLASSEGLVAHELAHQWFGDIVTCRDWSHAWINEGFATLLPNFWIREARGKDEFDLARHDTFEGAIGSQAATNRPVVWSGYEEPIDAFSGQVYGGGAARMFALMHELGEPLFWTAVKRYVEEYRYKPVATQQFFASIGKTAGRDLRPFMQQWFYTAALPRLTVDREGSELVIRQSQPYFSMQLPVWLAKGDGWDKRLETMTGAEVRARLASNDQLAFVDPEVRYPATVEVRIPYTADEWMRLYRIAPSFAQKARLLPTLATKLNDEQRLMTMREEKSPILLSRMIRGVPSESFLLDLTRHEDVRVVQAAVRDLASKAPSDAAKARWREILETHANPVLRQDALDAILRYEKEAETARWAWRQQVYNDGFRIAAGGWFVRNDPEYARELALKVLEEPDSERLRVAAIEALGMLKDKPGERRVFNALVAVAREPSFGARIAAIRALQAYGDRAAIPAIRTAQNHSLVFMRRAARAAIDALGK